MPRAPRWTITLGAGLSLLVLGCGPEILEFDVQPRRVCPGDTVHITWKVRGTPLLLAVRRTEDSVDIIRYTLVSVARGDTARSPIDVITYPPAVPKVLIGATAAQGTDSIVARDSARAAVWHTLVQVGEVVSDSGRELRVRHGGREGVVGPGRDPSPVWSGLPVTGSWEMSSGLRKGEVTGHPTRHPPGRLYLRVGLVCARGTQP